MSIKGKLISIVISTILVVSLIDAIESIHSIKSLSNANIEEFKQKAYKDKEIELKNYVSIAMKSVNSQYERTSKEKIKQEVSADLKKETNLLFSIINTQYKLYKDELTTNELKNRIKTIISSTRYADSGYFWINDLNAKIVDHPIKPKLNGKNLSNFKDKNGKKIFTEFANVAKANKYGFVDYVWPKPGFDTPQPKVSYVKLFEPFGWVIGTGAYVSDVTSSIQKEALSTIASMRYGKTGYFWVNDKSPKMIMHPIKPSLNGKDLSSVKDKKGKYLFKEMADIASSKGSGFVKYYWHKNDAKGVQPKLSYVEEFKPWGWIIGTGTYIDDIQAQVDDMEAKATEQIEKAILEIIIIVVVLSLVISAIMIFLSNKAIVKPIEKLNSAIKSLINHDVSQGFSKIEKDSDDELGNVVDSFNDYLHKIEAGIKEDKILIEDAKNVMNKVKVGNYSQTISSSTSNSSLEEFKNGVNEMIRTTKEHYNEIGKILDKYSNYDYTQRLILQGIEPNSEISALARDINSLRDAINQMLVDSKHRGDILNDSSHVLLNNVSTLSKNSNQAAAALEQTASAIEEIASNITNSSHNVSKMAEYATSLTTAASTGQKLARDTTDAMDDIDSEVSSINDAITVIDQIAFQTNILSLNAAVEAATAGEAGKGFAVVAGEVRNLASRSAEAAKEIKILVENATQKANHGKDISNQMIDGYSSLNDNINKTIELIDDIKSASQEQSLGIAEINKAVTVLDQQTQENANIASKTNDVAKETDAIAQEIVATTSSKKFLE
jgi:methyl-accepting chemotaxis protein